MEFAVISCSGSEESVSRIGARCARDALEALGHVATVLDIRSVPAFRVTPSKLDDAPHEITEMAEHVARVDGVILCYPIYCYTASATAKAVTELLGAQMEEKPVATVVAAGSLRSHLAAGDLMLSMMYEQSTFCFPKSVLLTSDDIERDHVMGETATRLRVLCDDFARFTRCLAGYHATQKFAPPETSGRRP